MDCTNNHISFTDTLRSLVRTDGTVNGLAIVEVEDHTEAAIRCGAENAHMSFTDFLLACIGVDTCGKPAIRVKYIDTCDSQITCSTNDDVNFLNQIFAYDSTLKTYALVINQSS